MLGDLAELCFVIYSFIYSFVFCLFVYLFIYLFIYLIIYLFSYLLVIYLFICTKRAWEVQALSDDRSLKTDPSVAIG